MNARILFELAKGLHKHNDLRLKHSDLLIFTNPDSKAVSAEK